MTHYSGPENSMSNGNVIKFLEEEYMYSADYIVFLTCSLWFKLKYLSGHQNLTTGSLDNK